MVNSCVLRYAPTSLQCAALTLACAAIGSSPSAGQDQTPPPEVSPLRAADIFEIEYASDPQISPDGSQVAYVRRFHDAMVDRVRSNIWVVNSDGSNHRPLLTGLSNYSSPRWSPDGQRLLYSAADEEGRGQLYLRWMDTGQTALLTRFERAPGGVSWSPDGSSIAFSMFVPSEAKPFAKPAKKPRGAEWAAPATSHEDLWYRADGRGFLQAGFSQIFVLPAEGGTPLQLTDDEFHHRGQPQWSPDGSALYLSANRRSDWQHHRSDTEIYRINLADGAMTQLTDRRGPDTSPVVSPDGNWIAYLGYEDQQRAYQLTRLTVMRSNGSEAVEWSSNFDYDISALRWSADGSRLYFQYDAEGDSRVASIDRAGKVVGHAAQVGGTSLGRPYTSGSYSVSADGTIAFTLGGVHRPAEVAVASGESMRQLTQLNADLFVQRNLGRVEEVRYTSSADELEIEGWVVYPPDYDAAKKYPLVLEIHGGPAAAYGPWFSAECQLYAAAGYVVLYTNPRGSTSYGENFADAIFQAYPGKDYDDLMSGIDLMVERGIADPEQLFVTGGSGGGLLSAWIVTQNQRFQAAAIAKPVINWYSFALTSDVGFGFLSRYFPGKPWEALEDYMARSPIHFAHQVETPSLLITGEVDWRTPMSESEQFYQALKEQGVDAALVRIPGASHSITARPSNLIAKVNHILAWFERYRSED